jgi:transcriptional regulator with XRE-family HTH domain
MHETFGARLRHQREKKGVSLRTIANQTKIKLSLLEGLERDDIRQWPAGIFRRAFVRDYAQAIGLDPDAVVREFVEQYPAPIEIPEPPPPPPRRFRSLVESALGTLRPGSSRESEPTAGQQAMPAAKAIVTAEPSGVTVDGQVPGFERRTSTVGPSRLVLDSSADSAEKPAPDLLAAARICTELGRVEHTRQVSPLLREAAGLLGAKGLIVWVWDALSQELKPALALGYPSRVLSQLGSLSRDADNATADAFRSAEARSLGGALVVPLLTPAACAGVLAIELSNAGRPAPPVMAIAMILAAMLAQLIGTTESS